MYGSERSSEWEKLQLSIKKYQTGANGRFMWVTWLLFQWWMISIIKTTYVYPCLRMHVYMTIDGIFHHMFSIDVVLGKRIAWMNELFNDVSWINSWMECHMIVTVKVVKFGIVQFFCTCEGLVHLSSYQSVE